STASAAELLARGGRRRRATARRTSRMHGSATWRPKGQRGVPDSDILPSTRRPPCNDYTFAEKTAVDQDNGRREKNGHFSFEINAVDGSTGKTSEIAPWGPFSRWPHDGLALPEFLRRSAPAWKGYIIRVTDGRTGNKLDLCRVAANPEPVAEAARRQTYKI